MQLHFLILGCKPIGRNIEQHDAFFGIGNSLKDLVPQIENFWPDAGKIHVDSWRVITNIDGHTIKVINKEETDVKNENKLFFLNLGGYKPNDLEEYHYKVFAIAPNKSEAIKKAKETAFFMHNTFSSHIDDKYGVDVDDVYEIEEVLPTAIKNKYAIIIEKKDDLLLEDELHIGYLKLSTLSS